MTKEEALKQLEALQQEEVELRAEEASVKGMLNNISHSGSCRCDEFASHVNRMWNAVRARIKDWCMRMAVLEQSLMEIPGYA